MISLSSAVCCGDAVLVFWDAVRAGVRLPADELREPARVPAPDEPDLPAADAVRRAVPFPPERDADRVPAEAGFLFVELAKAQPPVDHNA